MSGGSTNAAYEKDGNGLSEGHMLEPIAEAPKLNTIFVDRDFSYSDQPQAFSEKYSSEIKFARILIINLIFGGYFAWATYHFVKNKKWETENYWCNGYGMFLVLVIFTYSLIFYFKVIKRFFGRAIATSMRPYTRKITVAFERKKYLKFIVIVILLAIFGIFMGIDSYDSPERLRSLLGVVILLAIGFAFSKHRTHINWRTVICGVSLQFLMGLFCIRIDFGRKIFECLGDRVAVFFEFAREGAAFVYGEYLVNGNQTLNLASVFVFSSLPVIFFFSFIVSILYYYGAMQWIIKQMGCLLQSIMGTTLCESVTVAANIFLGMTESPLIIKPYIRYLTASEIHVIMSSGFATVSGTVLAAYMSFGADASLLITSSVMAAPATLAFSKLIYPETEISQTTSKSFSMEKSQEDSVMDAASNGAFAAVNLIAGIIANLVAFVSFIAFANAVVAWLGSLVGFDFLSVEWFFGKLFVPLAYIMGVEWNDCTKVGEVIAAKNIVNEFVAYKKLGELKAAHAISQRSIAITTFAICGFANLGSLGMMIGNLGTMCPEKRSVITSVSIRALISGSIICFINASIAGLLMTPDMFAQDPQNTTLSLNVTTI